MRPRPATWLLATALAALSAACGPGDRADDASGAPQEETGADVPSVVEVDSLQPASTLATRPVEPDPRRNSTDSVPATQPSLPEPPPQAPDTSDAAMQVAVPGADSLPTGAGQEPLPAGVGESGLGAQRAQLDSLRAEVARLMDAQATLVRQNETLQTAVSALSAMLASSSAMARPAQPDTLSAQDVLNDARQTVRHLGPRAFIALVFLIAAMFLIRGTVYVLDTLSEKNAKRRLFYKRLVPVTRILLWTLTIYIIVAVIFRVDARGVLAAAAAVGVAVGFAAQDILKNIFGGLILVFDQPFQVGDKISVGGTYGEVHSIGLRSTRIVTPDDNLVTVPNAQVVDGQVANANAGQLYCQVVTDLYLPGWVDESRAKAIAYDAAAMSRYVYLNKPIVVIVTDEFKETFLTHLKVKAYVLDPRYEFLFMSDVTERARAGFREHGLLTPTHGARAMVDFLRFSGEPVGAGAAENQAQGDGAEGEGGA